MPHMTVLPFLSRSRRHAPPSEATEPSGPDAHAPVTRPSPATAPDARHRVDASGPLTISHDAQTLIDAAATIRDLTAQLLAVRKVISDYEHANAACSLAKSQGAEVIYYEAWLALLCIRLLLR